ncbi:MAG: hypothetical protein EXS02_12265 [Planctomycetes bacterium]|nr:hypothetical protein [Planctomycetota bacterium]
MIHIPREHHIRWQRTDPVALDTVRQQLQSPRARCVKREPCRKPNSKRLAACCGDTRDYSTVTFGNALTNDGLGEKASHHAKNPPRKTRQMPTSIAQWQPAR